MCGNNWNKCSITYKDKIIPLQSYFLFNDINEEDKKNKKFEKLLLELEYISDKSCMFYDCKSLIEFGNYEINKNEIKDNVIEEEENNLNSEDAENFNDFYQNNIVDVKMKLYYLLKKYEFNVLWMYIIYIFIWYI